MSYRIEVAPAAERQLRRLDPKMRTRIAARLRPLAENPRPHGAKQLSAPERLWRLRVGAWRVIYQIHDDRLVVLVLRVGHRGEVYRKLDSLRGR
ncbi:MAG: type II toxin-antitoxin system RelE family toxin [Geminicoccaceae bacterium]